VRTSYEYDALGRQITIIRNDIGGAATSDNNVVTQYVYDVKGNRVAVVNVRDGQSFTGAVTTYDELGRPLSVSDALGNTTFYQYNALGSRTVMSDSNGAVTR
jgi:YD repeat-containing protein